MENIRKELSREEASNILKEIESNGAMSITEELIKDNSISFTIKEINYRVRLLNLREKEELDLLRRKKFGQLLQDKDLMLKTALIKVYKERGIDIGEMDDKIKKIESEIHEKKISLGESLAHNDTQIIFKTFEEQISMLIVERNILETQKNDLLQYSIEEQLLNYIAEIITYLCTEVEISEGKYTRLWKNLDDFKNCEIKELVERAGIMSTLLQYSM